MDELGFANDRPIKAAEQDLLGRSAFAKNLAAAIVGWKNQESLVIALTGLWGSGKSSIKNLAIQELRDHLLCSGKSCRLRQSGLSRRCDGYVRMARWGELGSVLSNHTVRLPDECSSNLLALPLNGNDLGVDLP